MPRPQGNKRIPPNEHSLKQSPSTYTVDQHEYLEKVLERCRMINAKPARTPLPQGYQPEKNTAPVNPELRTHFQMVIGSLLYLMLRTRPDIAYAVTQMAQQSANPTREHLDKALHIC